MPDGQICCGAVASSTPIQLAVDLQGDGPREASLVSPDFDWISMPVQSGLEIAVAAAWSTHLSKQSKKESLVR
jgi:hypothetical protein